MKQPDKVSLALFELNLLGRDGSPSRSSDKETHVRVVKGCAGILLMVAAVCFAAVLWRISQERALRQETSPFVSVALEKKSPWDISGKHLDPVIRLKQTAVPWSDVLALVAAGFPSEWRLREAAVRQGWLILRGESRKNGNGVSPDTLQVYLKKLGGHPLMVRYFSPLQWEVNPKNNRGKKHFEIKTRAKHVLEN